MTNSCIMGLTHSRKNGYITTCPSAFYTLPFICSSVSENASHASLTNILYAEAWCSNRTMWRQIITNILSETQYNQSYSTTLEPTKVEQMKITTRVHKNHIIGTVSWVADEMDVELLNEYVKKRDAQGIFVIEPYWTTGIILMEVVKTPFVRTD